jgi:hypothetical protein
MMRKILQILERQISEKFLVESDFCLERVACALNASLSLCFNGITKTDQELAITLLLFSAAQSEMVEN